MSPIRAAILGALGLLVGSGSTRKRETSSPPSPAPGKGGGSARTAEMRALITAIATRYNVPPLYALAFAKVESGFDPTAQGDRAWHLKKDGAKYRILVRDAPKFVNNPARYEPEAWHSYGLFQLLAVYHVRPTEHPRVLLDPLINAERGISTIGRLLERTNGDVFKARLLYTGGIKASASVQEDTRKRLAKALADLGGSDAGDSHA